jgi:hypothetical protein
MNVSVERMSRKSHRLHGWVPWVAVLGAAVGFVVVMETFESLMMGGVISEGIANGVGIPIVLLLWVIPIVLGARAIRRRAAGLPWIPTIIAGVALAFLLFGLLMNILV